MPFLREISVPRSLKTDSLILRLITVDHAELDYAAVMESREYLRYWEQSTWPEDDFTVSDNRKDVEKLERWNAENLAFTYTVLDLTESRCLGCVYIFPTNASMFQKAQIKALGQTRWGEHEAAVYFWVRKSQMEKGTDRVLLDTLRAWIDSAWDLSGHVFVTNEQFEQQVQMLESAALELRFEIQEDGKVGKFRAYA